LLQDEKEFYGKSGMCCPPENTIFRGKPASPGGRSTGGEMRRWERIKKEKKRSRVIGHGGSTRLAVIVGEKFQA